MRKKRIVYPPGFWNECITPATEVAKAIQYPMEPADQFINRLMTAYQKDCGILKKKGTTHVPD